MRPNQTENSPKGDEAPPRGTMRLWPEAGHRLGIGRAATYEAARNKQIPTIRIGRRILVPVAALERMLA